VTDVTLFRRGSLLRPSRSAKPPELHTIFI
jgi:hypothetical protein